MNILTAIASVLFVAWILGVVGVYSIGIFVHLFLLVALVMFFVRLTQEQPFVKTNHRDAHSHRVS